MAKGFLRIIKKENINTRTDHPFMLSRGVTIQVISYCMPVQQQKKENQARVNSHLHRSARPGCVFVAVPPLNEIIGLARKQSER